MRRTTGPFRFELTSYYTRFNGFIFRRLTGNTCDGTACIDAADPAGPLELRQAVYSQQDAIFRGAEFQSQLDVAPLWTGIFGIENQFDVRARDLHRRHQCAPHSAGALGRRPILAQRQLACPHQFSARLPAEPYCDAGETATAGYNDLRAELSYRWKPRRPASDQLSEVVIGVVGSNLLNDEIRNHVSYTKDEVLMPGRSVRFFANLKY